jgi:hypothetical protein
MSNAPAAAVLGPAESRHASSSSPTFEVVEVVEIVTRDRRAAAFLRDYASPSFPAELVPGSTWIVRFRRPASCDDWAEALLALVERLHRSTPLPLPRGGVFQGPSSSPLSG